MNAALPEMSVNKKFFLKFSLFFFTFIVHDT